MEGVTVRRTYGVIQSIALELEMACRFLSASDRPELPPEAALIPPQWREEGQALAGPGRGWDWHLGAAAWLAGVLAEADYRTATLAIRELTAEEALDRLIRLLGAPKRSDLAPAEQLVDEAARWMQCAYGQYGIALAQIPGERWDQELRAQLTALTRVLKGGDLHARFWLWLDQGYFQFYLPWRATRTEQMEERRREAQDLLAAQGLEWLSPQTPIQTYPGLRAAVVQGDLELACWIDPFGLFDYWHLVPGQLTISVWPPELGLHGFRAGAEAVSGGLKALADPTRLMILRLIRRFAMDNTEMAGYLGLTRQTVSVHTQVLREAGLIETAQHGRQASHTINAEEVERLCGDLMRFLELRQPGRP